MCRLRKFLKLAHWKVFQVRGPCDLRLMCFGTKCKMRGWWAGGSREKAPSANIGDNMRNGSQRPNSHPFDPSRPADPRKVALAQLCVLTFSHNFVSFDPLIHFPHFGNFQKLKLNHLNFNLSTNPFYAIFFEICKFFQNIQFFSEICKIFRNMQNFPKYAN